MTTRGFRRRRVILIASAAAACCLQVGTVSARMEMQGLPITVDAGAAPPLRFADGLISAEIEGTPLIDVLAQVAHAAGIRVRFVDPAAATLPVLASFEKVSLEGALRMILRDASYVLYAAGQDQLLLVLSSAASRSQSTGSSQSPAPAQLVLNPGAVEATESAEVRDSSAGGATLGPEEFGSERHLALLKKSALDPATAADGIRAMDKLAEVSIGGAVDDDRAIRVLNDIATRQGIVVEMRKEAASGIAAVALSQSSWSKAERLPSVEALRRLATSPDEAVNEIARGALQTLAQQPDLNAPRGRDPR